MSKKKQTNTFSLHRFLRQHFFLLCSGAIILVAALLRFYDYPHRFTLASDQAGFALVARFALKTLQLPLLGPFSSAGPFQTGGEWYWLVMLGQLLYFDSIISPWVFMTILSLVFVGLMIFLGTKLVSKQFGLLVGLLTAVSTGQIIQAPNLTNQTPLMLFSALAVLMSIMYCREKKMIYLFFLGLSVGLAASVHLQGVAVAPIILFTLLLNRVTDLKHYVVVILGGLIPWLPVLFVDINNNFFTVRNMLEYYFFNSEQVSYEALGRRWMTFLGIFVPSAWAYTIGGFRWVGYLLMLLSGILFLFLAYKKKLAKEWYIIFFSTFVMIILLRYTRTPIFESYFVFMHPLILLISSWCVYILFTIRKELGILLGILIIITSFSRSSLEIAKQKSTAVQDVSFVRSHLRTTFPGEHFVIYDHRYRTTSFSLPLTLFLDEEDLLEEKGRRIGVTGYYNKDDKNSISVPSLWPDTKYAITDLSSSTSAQLKQQGWVLIDPETVYLSVQEWYK
jgi:hypothetical protein